MPAKSRKLSDIADDLKELASRAHAIRKQVDLEYKNPEIIQLHNRIKIEFSEGWQDSDFADFCAQFLTITFLISFLSKTGEADNLDFLQIHQTLAKVPSIIVEIANMLMWFESWVPHLDDLDFYALDPEDQVTRLYELFLGVYDKRARDSLGTFYTPPPVVDFIVRGVNNLGFHFNAENGIMSGTYEFLDPASGTNVFLSRALRFHLRQSHPPGTPGPRFPRDFLQHYETHEIQSTPYCLGLLNVLFLLRTTWKQDLPNGIPWKCRMWDTLEHFGEETDNQSSEGKKTPQLLVVWGNPPYKKDAKTESPALAKAMKRYQDPVRFEKSLRVLSDYYVKFLRYAHERVLKAGQGIVALVLNSSYIDGPVHRGLRESLIQDFSHIYVVNLHGAIQPPEITPPGVTDENVFDIRTGVSILFLLRTRKYTTPTHEIHYWDCWGSRIEKFEFLKMNDLNSMSWKLLPANRWGMTYNQFSLGSLPPTLIDTYARGISIRNLFKTMVMGVTTGKDEVLVGFTREELAQKIKNARSSLPLLNDIAEASIKDAIIPYNYRPLDFRYIFYVQGVVNRDRREVMKYLVGDQRVPGNVAIVTERFIRAAKAPNWNFIYATTIVADKSCISNQDNSHVYPLYKRSVKGRQDNIRKEVIAFLSTKYIIQITPKQVFDYILGLLSTPKYQTRFSALLGVDYPVILFPENGKDFVKIADLGSYVREALVLSGNPPESYFHAVNATSQLSQAISEVRYEPEKGRLWYASNEYVRIPQCVWDWYIGYFHPIEHYFLDRVGRTLTSAEVANVNRAISSLQVITQISHELDVTFEQILGFLDCHLLLVEIIGDELNRVRRLPIPGMRPSASEIARIRKMLYLPDEKITWEVLK